MLDPLYDVIGYILAFYYSIFPNPNYGLGIAIILLTCTVMLAMFPLTAKQTRSMIAMQRVQPEIKKIQQKYKDDKQKQNEELLKFYQENKINPLAGCLPLIVQSPVFIALLGVLRHISRMEQHIPHGSGRMGDLYRDLCGTGAVCKDPPTTMKFLTMDLMAAPSKLADVVSGPAGRIPYYLIVVVVMALGWYQTRQTMQRNQNRAGATPTPMNTQMQIMTKVMPVMIGVFTYFAPAGVGLYFVTSSAWRIGQQHLVLNKYYDHERHPPKQFKHSDDIDVEAEPTDADTAPRGNRTATKTNGAAASGSQSRPSQHTSRKKRKRRR